METMEKILLEVWHRLWQWLCLPMAEIVERSVSFRALTVSSVGFRLGLALVLGGMLGLERGRKNRPAGFRTYMLVCMSAAMTMILGQYISTLAQGLQTDMTRISAQVINGIGFLGAGTIIVTEKQQVKGLTTAAGLWAAACMGLALGAGFYECVTISFLLIVVVVLLLPKIEAFLVEKSRNMDIYVEVSAMEGIHQVIECLKDQGVQIFEVDIDRGTQNGDRKPNAIFSIRLEKRQAHTRVVERLSHLETICASREL